MVIIIGEVDLPAFASSKSARSFNLHLVDSARNNIGDQEIAQHARLLAKL